MSYRNITIRVLASNTLFFLPFNGLNRRQKFSTAPLAALKIISFGRRTGGRECSNYTPKTCTKNGQKMAKKREHWKRF